MSGGAAAPGNKARVASNYITRGRSSREFLIRFKALLYLRFVKIFLAQIRPVWYMI